MVINTEIDENKNNMNVHDVYYESLIFGGYLLLWALLVAVNLQVAI